MDFFHDFSRWYVLIVVLSEQVFIKENFSFSYVQNVLQDQREQQLKHTIDKNHEVH